MFPLCTDVDLLNWEPNILRDASFASQTLISGTGTMSGTTFTIATGSLIAAGVMPNHVIVLGSDSKSCFPILSIDSATTLTLSVLYDGFDESADAGARSPMISGTLPFVIRTFWPQRTIISELLRQAAVENNPGSVGGTILNPQDLRRACALGTLQMIYSALAAASSTDAQYSVRADLYQRLYQRAIRNTSVDIDLNGDGAVDVRRSLGIVSFRRA